MARSAVILLLAIVAVAQGHVLRSAAASAAAPDDKGGAKGTPALAGNMPLKAQEQGYSGKHVKHEDQKTSTADWGDEYGPEHEGKPKPNAGFRSGTSIALLILAVSAAIYHL